MAASRFFLLMLMLALLTGCQPAPGGEREIHRFEIQSAGIATIIRVHEKDGKTLLDFRWLAQNNLASAEIYKDIDSRKLLGLPANYAFQIGAPLPLTVTHYFQQRGSSTPQRLRSVWRYDADRAEHQPAFWRYRPPRCINQ